MALGRNLTWLETLWFDYSATKSDYYLYCHNILFLFLIFSLVPLPLVFIELAKSTSDWFDRYKIQPKVKNLFSDMFKCYKDVMKMFLLVIGPLQLVSYPSIQMIEIRSGLPLPSCCVPFSCQNHGGFPAQVDASFSLLLQRQFQSMVCSRRQRVYVSVVLRLLPNGPLGLIAAITINPIKVRLKKLFSRRFQLNNSADKKRRN